MNYVKSKQRVADHGEMFTPVWMAEWGYLDEGKFQQRDSAIVNSKFLVAGTLDFRFRSVLTKRRRSAETL